VGAKQEIYELGQPAQRSGQSGGPRLRANFPN
jgi:hypothetical protein